MSNVFAFLFLLSFLILIIGVIKPTKVKMQSRKQVLKYAGLASIICLFATGIATTETDNDKKILIAENADIVNNIYDIKNTSTPGAATTTDVTEVELELRNTNITNTALIPENNINIKYYSVVKIIDGDTIDVNIDNEIKRLRLIGIDTPEVVDPRKPVECFGQEASNKAKEILSNRKVALESDPSQGDKDKYGRYLRYVFLENGDNFNEYMIAEGYAYEYTYSAPYKYQTEFKKAQSTAKENKKGLWADEACNTTISGTTSNTASTANNTTTTTTPTSSSLTSAHAYYLSSYYSAKYYYCDTDEGWKSLSTKYLKSFSSENELLKNYPDRILHEACK